VGGGSGVVGGGGRGVGVGGVWVLGVGGCCCWLVCRERGGVWRGLVGGGERGWVGWWWGREGFGVSVRGGGGG